MGRTNRHDQEFEDEDFDAFIEECDESDDMADDLPADLVVVTCDDILEDQWLDSAFEDRFEMEL